MAWAVDIDGTDITSLCQQIRWRPRLSRPGSCVVRFPAHLFNSNVGRDHELHLTNGGLLFSGPVWFRQVDGTDDATYIELTAYDHLIYLNKRMCKTPIGYPVPDDTDNRIYVPGPCNLADPRQVLREEQTAPAIMAAFIQATKDCDGAFPLNVGSVASGGDDLGNGGLPADWPMNLQDIADMLLETGQLDMLLTPGYGSSTVNLTNGEGGNNSGVTYQYGTGAFNSRGGYRTDDMEEVINALWYLLAPKVYHYDHDISHWRGSITPTAANAGGDGQTPGGEPAELWPGDLVARWMGSRGAYGYMQEIQVHDAANDEANPFVRPVFEQMYAGEAYVRALPRTFAGITPDRSTNPPGFSVGDSINVAAGGALGGGFSGTERVYEFEITIDTEGVGEFTDLMTSQT